MARRLVHIALSLTLLLATAAHADPAPPLRELLDEALKSAPRALAVEAELAAAAGRARQARAWSNPSLALELENFSGSGPFRGSSQSQSTLSVTQSLPIWGQLGARARAGQAALAASERQTQQARADLAYDIVVAYATAEWAQRAESLAAADRDRAAGDLDAVRALVRAGREPELRQAQAEALDAAAATRLVTARATLRQALLNLSALAGAPAAYDTVAPALLEREPVASMATPAAAPALSSDAMPVVATALAERDAARARAVVERKRALPDVSLSVGRRRFGDGPDQAWVGGLGVSLPLFDRNQGSIAAAQAEVRAAEARAQAVRLEASAARTAAEVQFAAATDRLATARKGDEAAGEAYRLARIAYDAGRLSWLELSNARRLATEAQAQKLDAQLDGVRAMALLARLAGRLPFQD